MRSTYSRAAVSPDLRPPEGKDENLKMQSTVGTKRWTFRSLSGRPPQGLWFVLPAVLFFLVFSTYPTVLVILQSFTVSDFVTGRTTFAGLHNFASVLSMGEFWTALGHSLAYVLLSVALHLGLGVILASLLNQRISARFRSTARTLILLPWAITPVVVAGLWRLLYHPDLSFVPAIASSLGIHISWNYLGRPDTALFAVVAANVWAFVPFYTFMLLAKLQVVPSTLYEAAAIDGANPLQTFFSITLPQLKTTLGTLAIFDIMGTLTQFDLTWVMTRGGPLNATELLSTLVYKQAFEGFQFGLASTMSVAMFVLMIVLIGGVSFLTRE